jgi:hypothetical protein
MVPGMKFLAPLTAIALSGCSVVGIRAGTPEPAYKVIGTAGVVQIREYAPRLAASVTVPGDEVAARSAGFRRLAGFIFGGNVSKTSIEMTAPVGQSSEKIAMTAPVAQSGGAAGWTITFYMPAKYTAATLPKPNDPGIVVHEVPGEIYGVYRYSGFWSAADVHRAQAVLLGGLKGSGWVAVGAPMDWFYDPPWTLPFARRNEVAVVVVRR